MVVLGPTGRNVAAGMTGGLAYVLEESEGALDARLNKEIVQVQRVRTAAGEEQLRGLIESHVEVSGARGGAPCRRPDQIAKLKAAGRRVLVVQVPLCVFLMCF